MTDIKQLVQQELSAGGLFLDTEVRLDAGSPVMASPSWWGADSDHWIVDDATPNSVGSDRVFVKVMQQHSLEYVDVGASFRAAVAAGLAGIGPRVRHSNAATGVLVMDDLGRWHRRRLLISSMTSRRSNVWCICDGQSTRCLRSREHQRSSKISMLPCSLRSTPVRHCQLTSTGCFGPWILPEHE